MLRRQGWFGGSSLRNLHFQECNANFGRLLTRLHFHRSRIAHATDWWHPVTGQKEFAL